MEQNEQQYNFLDAFKQFHDSGIRCEVARFMGDDKEALKHKKKQKLCFDRMKSSNITVDDAISIFKESTFILPANEEYSLGEKTKVKPVKVSGLDTFQYMPDYIQQSKLAVSAYSKINQQAKESQQFEAMKAEGLSSDSQAQKQQTYLITNVDYSKHYIPSHSERVSFKAMEKEFQSSPFTSNKDKLNDFFQNTRTDESQSLFMSKHNHLSTGQYINLFKDMQDPTAKLEIDKARDAAHHNMTETHKKEVKEVYETRDPKKIEFVKEKQKIEMEYFHYQENKLFGLPTGEQEKNLQDMYHKHVCRQKNVHTERQYLNKAKSFESKEVPVSEMEKKEDQKPTSTKKHVQDFKARLESIRAKHGIQPPQQAIQQ